MKKILLAAGAGFILASACGQQRTERSINDANVQKREVSSFHAIQTEDGIDIYLTQGNEEALAVSASKTEYRDKIVSKVENGVLKLSYDDTWRLNWQGRRLRAYVSAKNIDAIEASGGSDILVQGTLSGDRLQLHQSGGSDFAGAVKLRDLDVEISGGSDVDISGATENLKVEASGGSDFLAFNLMAQNAVIDASGGSDARLNVARELTAEATGGSDIDYKGTPSVKRSSSSGGGSVSKRD